MGSWRRELRLGGVALVSDCTQADPLFLAPDCEMRFLSKLDDFLLASLVVVLADIVLFHAGAYFPLLQPESFSGVVESRLRWVSGRLEAFPGRNRIVVMGNSKAQACVMESQLEADLAFNGLRYHVINMSVGGSTPRSWYALMKEGRITSDNTEIVVIGVTDMSIEAHKKEGLRDLDISKTRLKIGDALTMASAYREFEDRLEVFSGFFFRTPLFEDDIKQLLASPARRFRQIAASRKRFSIEARIDNRSNRDLLSARLGKDGRLDVDKLDGFLKKRDNLRREVQGMLRHRKRLAAAMAQGRRMVRNAIVDPGKLMMLGRLVEDLNARGIKVVLGVVPAFPYSMTRPTEGDYLGNFFRDLERSGADVEVWHDLSMLRQLHSPRYFKDALHVNTKGAEIYTRRLAQFLGPMLASEANSEESSD